MAIRKRPITFCFNGGPGSASVWLHLGVLDQSVDIDEEGKVAKHPYHLKDNPYSILDVTDLVFIDPVSTGYSRAVPGKMRNNFTVLKKTSNPLLSLFASILREISAGSRPNFLLEKAMARPVLQD